MQRFDPYNFLRRMEAGEFDVTVLDEVDKLSEGELEQLALVIAGRITKKNAGVPCEKKGAD